MFDVPFVVRLEGLFELYFLSVSLGMKYLSLQTEGFLRICGGTVNFTSFTFPPEMFVGNGFCRTNDRNSLSLEVIQPPTMTLDMLLDILVL